MQIDNGAAFFLIVPGKDPATTYSRTNADPERAPIVLTNQIKRLPRLVFDAGADSISYGVVLKRVAAS